MLFQTSLPRWIVGLFLAGLIGMSCSLSADRLRAEEPVLHEKMNVIIVMTDEHNFRTLGCYRDTMEERQAYMWGPAIVETPHIDRIAKQGALCSSFYASTPVCSPSRASFISGLYPHATPVTTNNIPLRDDLVTFASILKGQGYATGYTGKWHLDGNGKPQWQPKRNFGFEDNRYMFNRGHWKKFELADGVPRVAAKSKNGQPSYGVDGADEKSFATDFLMDRTIEFIEANKSQPFCYMLSLPDPHGPDTVRPPYDTMFKDQVYQKPTTYEIDERTIPNWGEPARRASFGQSTYYGMVKCIDDNVGRLLAKLEHEGLLEKTMVVFTSDHGDLRGEHHRQNKGIAYEGSARVPFLVRYPKKIKPGTVIHQALTSVDFAPTLMNWLDVKTEQEFHGRDASVLFSNPDSEEAKSWQDVAFVRGTGEEAGWLMAVSDRYKLVFSTDEQPFVFDLVRDPDEVINQRDNPAYRGKIRELGRLLRDYAEKYNDPRGNAETMKKDLDWASGTAKYVPQKYPVRGQKNSGDE